MSTEHTLFVDDDEVLRERLARAFRDRGYTADTAQDFDSALAVAAARPPDFAVVDLRMPGKSGLELTGALKDRYPTCDVVILTGYGTIGTAIDAIRMRATYYVQKPADADEILAAIDRGRAPPGSEPAAEHGVPSLDRVEWEHLNRVLEDCSGNISEAARRLGMHRRTLQRKLQKYPPKS